MRHREQGREKGFTVLNLRRKKQPDMVGKDFITGAEEKNAPAGQGKVLFLGNRSDVDRIYQAMDVFVLPSRYEGLPVVGVEAQAAGLPCVMSDKMTKETKMTKEAVFLSIKDAPEKWARCVLTVKNDYRNREVCSGLSKEGFSIYAQAKKLLEFYKKA